MFTPSSLELLLPTQQNKSLMRSVPDPSSSCEGAGTQTMLMAAQLHVLKYLIKLGPGL